MGRKLEIERKIVKEWGRKRKDSLDLRLCISWLWRTPGPSQGTRRHAKQTSNPSDGGRGGAESGSGLPTLGNSVIGEYCFSYRLRRRGTTIRPREERAQPLMDSLLEAEGYPHTGRIEEDSIGECFVSMLVELERRCIDEGYYLCLFGDYSGCVVPLAENTDCIGLRP